MWAFRKVRDYTIREIDKLTQPPIERIELAIKCSVEKWLLPAYEQLCNRADRLTLQEAERLGMIRYHIISQIREQKNVVPTNTSCNNCGYVFPANQQEKGYDVTKAILAATELGFERMVD